MDDGPTSWKTELVETQALTLSLTQSPQVDKCDVCEEWWAQSLLEVSDRG